ncbi:unnamed protein product, partial [Closterium sp. NIES-53]
VLFQPRWIITWVRQNQPHILFEHVTKGTRHQSFFHPHSHIQPSLSPTFFLNLRPSSPPSLYLIPSHTPSLILLPSRSHSLSSTTMHDAPHPPITPSTHPPILLIPPSPVDQSDRLVALTIDDGPNGDTTHELLDILKEHGRLCWQWTPSSSGPWVAHQENAATGAAAQLSCVSLTRPSCLHHTSSSLPPPSSSHLQGHGWYTKRMRQQAQRHGYNVALGSVFPVDPLFKDSSRPLAAYCLWKVYPGAIIILHDRPQQGTQTVEILRMMLPELRRQGYQVVSLSHLVKGLHSHASPSHSHASSPPQSLLSALPASSSSASHPPPVNHSSLSSPHSGAPPVEESGPLCSCKGDSPCVILSSPFAIANHQIDIQGFGRFTGFGIKSPVMQVGTTCYVMYVLKGGKIISQKCNSPDYGLG